MDLIFECRLDCFPPTLNHQTWWGNGKPFDSPEYEQFKEDAALLLRLAGCPDVSKAPAPAYSLAINFYWHGWFKKDGSLIKGRDASNRYKSIEDAVFLAMGIDDSLNVFPSMLKKRPKPDEKQSYIEISIAEYDLDSYRADILGEDIYATV